MESYIVEASSEKEAIKKCQNELGFTPDAVREVAGRNGRKAYMCFESAADAETWDKQI